MRTLRTVCLLVAATCLQSAVTAAQTRPPEVAALIGLARTARDQGRLQEAVEHFREADTRQRFEGPLLIEYFWAAHRAQSPAAREIGARVLASSPAAGDVRDGLIGLAAALRDEAAVQELARGGASLEGDAALWPRRLGESALRRGDAAEAARFFEEAARRRGGSKDDLAQRALALELTADKDAAVAAWAALDEGVVASRPEWRASRERAQRATRPPRVARAAAPPRVKRPTAPEDVARASARRLEADACAVAPLRALEALSEEEPFLMAVRTRPASCPDQVAWRTKAAERALAVGRFTEALALIEPSAVSAGAPAAARALYGTLRLWTGDARGALPFLEGARVDGLADDRATDALIDAYRATGNPDSAWTLASSHWTRSEVPADRRLAVAALALETGRLTEALARARDLMADATAGARARRVAAGALVALGRAEEARRALGSFEPTAPDAALAWLDAVALADGIGAALDLAAPVDGRTGAEWAELNARLAVWHAGMGHRREAARRVEALTRDDAGRAELAAAEVALVIGRPADAVAPLAARTSGAPRDVRAADLLSTAYAESGQWDRALDTLARVRTLRPHDARLAVREAEWRHRQSPSHTTLSALEAAVAAAPDVADGPAALARAYLVAGAPARAIAALAPDRTSAIPDHVLWLAARAERAAGHPDRAAAIVARRPRPTLDLRLLGAELAGLVDSDAAVAERVAPLVSGPDADPLWYLAWAAAVKDVTAADEVIRRGIAAFPDDASLQERQAVIALAKGDLPAARRAADRAMALDDNRIGSWFVAVQAAGRAGDDTAVLSTARRFARRFDRQPTALLAMGDTIAGLGLRPGDAALAEALGWAAAVRAQQPGLPAGIVTYARLLVATGHRPRALEATEAFLRDHPGVGTARKLHAELLTADNRFAQALAAYDRYLELEPGDVAARRQQARIAGWQGDFTASLRRYDDLVRDHPSLAGLAHERDAKRAASHGRWHGALAAFDRWLAVEPDDVEGRLERAQALDRLGRPRQAAGALRDLAADEPRHPFAYQAASRIEGRGRTGADLYALGISADGAVRQQLLDLVDGGAGLSTGAGGMGQRRVRVFGGPSNAWAPGAAWQGYNVGADLRLSPSSALDLSGTATRRELGGIDAAWFGQVRGDWRLGDSVRLTAGAERSLVLDNRSSLETGLAGYGPLVGFRWRPDASTSVEATARRQAMTDGNVRRMLRADAARRLWHRVHEVRLLAVSEFLGHDEARGGYFAPRGFWRHDLGVDGRYWLTSPRFFGDRERFVSGGYLYGVDNRGVRYHTARAGFAYEVTPGAGLVADVLVVRSRVYDGVVMSAGLRLRQLPTPSR